MATQLWWGIALIYDLLQYLRGGPPASAFCKTKTWFPFSPRETRRGSLAVRLFFEQATKAKAQGIQSAAQICGRLLQRSH